MKLVWLLLFAVFTINVSNAKSMVENVPEKRVNRVASPKTINPSSYTVTRRQNSSVFPNMPDRRRKFVVNLRPRMRTESLTVKPAMHSNRLMKKLPINYTNYKGNAKIPTEVTTRRTLMKIRKFTVKPHVVHAESIREKYNYNSNRKINTINFRKPKNSKPSNGKGSSEQRFLNFKNEDMSINDNNSGEFEIQEKKNGYVAAGSQKSKTIILFPKINNTKYLKVDPEQKIPDDAFENNSVSVKKIDIVSTHKEDHDGKVTEEKVKSVITPPLVIKSEPQDNFSEQEKADHHEFIFINGVKHQDITLAPVVTHDDEMTTDSDLDIMLL